jgi:hypothetical protein
MQEVDGQTGITISMTMSMTATGMAWEDNDGFGTCTSTGAVILSGVTMPGISLSSVVIDAGTCAGVSYVAIDTGTDNIVAGTMTINSLIIGSSDTAATQSLGKFVQRDVGISFGVIEISGHAAP